MTKEIAIAADVKEIKILMLHGYTQSGPNFRLKTRSLEKLLTKFLAPHKLRPSLIYPTAPIKLSPRDLPGFEPQSSSSSSADHHPTSTSGGYSGNNINDDDEIDAWSWFRKDDATGTYRFLKEGFDTIAECIRDECDGQVDGVMGFSQGGCMAGLLASAMENSPSFSFQAPRSVPEAAVAGEDDYDWSWVEEVRKANGGKPLKFAVIYSGFYATPESLGWLYDPVISTPSMHFIGSLDTVVEEGRSQKLVDSCKDAVVVVHPGGHYTPVNREWVMPVAGFIKRYSENVQENQADERQEV